MSAPPVAASTPAAPSPTGLRAGPAESGAGSRRTGRIRVVDGLRLIAALMVVAYHYVGIGVGWPHAARRMFPGTHLVAAYGWLGVELFFLISGFVICMTCWGKSLGDFFVSRVVRLYPAYWFGIVATTAVVVLIPGGLVRRSITDIVTNFTMLQAPLYAHDVDAVYWTLAAELRFYLLFALVVWRGLTYRRVIVFCCVWAFAAASFTGYDDSPLKTLLMPDRCWYFIAGIALYLIYRFGPNLLSFGIVVVCLLASERFVLIQLGREEKSMHDTVPHWPAPVLVFVIYALMTLVATGRLSWINWGWLSTAGALTYPLYLLHEDIGWEIIRKLAPHLPAYAVLIGVVGVMLLASWAVHRWVEQPVGRWLRNRLRRSLVQIRALSTSDAGAGDPADGGDHPTTSPADVPAPLAVTRP